MKILTKILLLLSLLLVLVLGLFYDSHYIAPSRFTIRFETVESSRIPETFDNHNILFFSDVYYAEFMNNERLNLLVDKINSVGADIVIFGGDLLSTSITDEQNAFLLDALSRINAPLGKFAILGDLDMNQYKAVTQLLTSSHFEILENKSVQLRNKSNQGINLVGLSNSINAEQNLENAFSNIVRTNYTITVCHTPDTFNDITSYPTDLYLTGHSLGGQIFYIFDSFYKPTYTNYYFKGKTIVNNSIVDVSSGTGTTKKDIRFLSNAEVVVYRLKHKEVSQ